MTDTTLTPDAPPALPGAAVTYSGSLTEWHGPARIVEVCYCLHCDEDESLARACGWPAPAVRWVLIGTVYGQIMRHVRRESFEVQS